MSSPNHLATTGKLQDAVQLLLEFKGLLLSVAIAGFLDVVCRTVFILRGHLPIGNNLYRNQHNFLRRTVMTIFFIYLRTELKFFVVLWVWFTRHIGGRPKFDLEPMPYSE